MRMIDGVDMAVSRTSQRMLPTENFCRREKLRTLRPLNEKVIGCSATETRSNGDGDANGSSGGAQNAGDGDVHGDGDGDLMLASGGASSGGGSLGGALGAGGQILVSTGGLSGGGGNPGADGGSGTGGSGTGGSGTGGNGNPAHVPVASPG